MKFDTSSPLFGLLMDLVKMNPNVDFHFYEDYPPEVEVNVATENFGQLHLPQGFYFADANGITNKHHTADGSYVSLLVRSSID